MKLRVVYYQILQQILTENLQLDIIPYIDKHHSFIYYLMSCYFLMR